MKVTTEELERCEILMTVEVPAADERKMLRKAAKKIARQVQIPGFRPGKAPYNTVVRRYGLEVVQQEALEDSVEKIIQNALSEADLRPFAQISLDDISWEPLTIKIKVPSAPNIELGDYRELRLEAEPVEVSEDDLAAELSKIQEEQATWAPVERPAEVNDLITIAVTEKDGEEVLAEHDSVEYELVLPEEEAESETEAEIEAEAESDAEAEDQDEDDADDESEEDDEPPAPPFRPDLTTPLLGLSAGDEKSFSIDYPADYQDEKYAGKAITFEVKVSSIKEKELDPLDDDFAQAVSDFETLAEFKEDIEKNLRESRQRQADQELGQNLLDKVIETAVTIEWPEALEEEAIDDEVNRFKDQFERSGLNLEDYLQIQGQSDEEFREQLRESVVAGLKRSVVLGELAKLEQVSINNAEILEQAKSIADSFGGDDQIWQNLISSPAYQNRLANDMLSDKVIMRLAEVAKGEAPDLEADTAAEDEPAAELVVEAEATEAEATEVEATEAEATDDGAENETTAEETVATKA